MIVFYYERYEFRINKVGTYVFKRNFACERSLFLENISGRISVDLQ